MIRFGVSSWDFVPFILWRQLSPSIYVKRDDFNFHITNLLFSSKIPSSPAYDVFISQLIRYAHTCSSYRYIFFWGQRDFPICFSNRIRHRMLAIAIEEVLLSILVFCQTIWRFTLTYVKWHFAAWPYTMTPSTDQTLHLFTELDLLPNYKRFPQNICDGCCMLTGDVHCSGHRVPVPFGTCPSCWDQFFSKSCREISALSARNIPVPLTVILDFA